MPTARSTAPRKRNRRRKRRLVSSSSSSPSSDSSDSSSDQVLNKITTKEVPWKQQATPSEEEGSSSSSTSPSSSSDSENDASHVASGAPASPHPSAKMQRSGPGRDRADPSPSPSPPPVDVPPFLAPEGSSSRAQDEQALRNRFRQFWMASVADAFGDDLDQIRKVCAVFSSSVTVCLFPCLFPFTRLLCQLL
jgi:ribosome assembly protein 3